MSKYSAGPLTFRKGSSGYYIKNPTGCVLGVVYQYPEEAPLAKQCLPNAKLWSAAPEMLEALKDAHTQIENEGMPNLLNRLDKIIKKAGGTNR